MKYFRMVVLATAVVLCAGFLAQPAHAQLSFDLAYSNLSQHGSWIVSAEYGHVWQPREYNREWNPYYDGHWVYTEMGWTWVSDYEWGAIPYHYGTWVSEPRFGWVWIPGNVWAPAWVVFRTGPDCIGWAPVPPGYSIGVSIDFGVSSSFVFVSPREFLAPRIRASIMPVSRTNVFINNTTVVNNIVIQNNIVINRGPDIRIVEKATGRAIRRQRIESVARVAPFSHVSRAQLAVDPQRVKRGVRVAEPVPASRALPVSDKGAKRSRETSRAGTSLPSGKHSPSQAVARQQAEQPQAAPGTASGTAPKPQGNGQAARTERAAANSRLRAQQQASARTDTRARAELKAKTVADAKLKAKQKAKAAADAKARKQEEDAGGRSTEPGTTPKSDEGTPQ